MESWQLAEAKNKFSEVFTKAIEEGAQRVTRRGQAVIVVSEEEFNRLASNQRTIKDWLFSAPDFSELDLERDRSPMREVEW